MATKAEITGLVVSDKMDKSVVVAVERQIRDALYGKTQKRTSKFLAHNEANDVKIGDREVWSRTITDADVVVYAGIIGDRGPMHLDENFAKKTRQWVSYKS